MLNEHDHLFNASRRFLAEDEEMNEDRSENESIILNTELNSGSGYKYRGVLVKTDAPYKENTGEWIVKIEEYFPKTDEWQGTPGQWYLSTLLGTNDGGEGKPLNDKIMIDAGQNWYVTGMKSLYDEIKKHVPEEFAKMKIGLSGA